MQNKKETHKLIRIARSGDAKSFMMEGRTKDSKSWLDNFPPIFKIGVRAFAPAPPNSNALSNSGYDRKKKELTIMIGVHY